MNYFDYCAKKLIIFTIVLSNELFWLLC